MRSMWVHLSRIFSDQDESRTQGTRMGTGPQQNFSMSGKEQRSLVDSAAILPKFFFSEVCRTLVAVVPLAKTRTHSHICP